MINPAVEAEEIQTDYISVHNPLYEGLTADQASQPVQPTSYAAKTEAEAIQYARQQMVSRSTKFEFTLKHSRHRTPKQECQYIMSQAMEHTGKPKEGDYLHHHFVEWKSILMYASLPDAYESTFTIEITYYTSQSQENAVDTKIASVMSSLNLHSKTEEGKIRAIHDYICQNVKYDKNSTQPIRHSAYSALINGKAVCQGYSSLFYRMCLEAGIDCRVVGGTAEGGDHAWNIVKLGEYYYNMDVTFDENLNSYTYYLKNNADFSDHHVNSEVYSHFHNYKISPTSWSSASNVPATGIRLNKTSLSLAEGKSEQLTATISPSTATNKIITWTSSNIAIATVDHFGNVKAIKAGTATITAKSHNDKTATCTITVTADTSVSSISLNKTSLSLIEGDSEKLIATILPSNAANKSITWTSSNTAIATVDSNGHVKAIKAGTATITAKSNNNKTASCTITIHAKTVADPAACRVLGFCTYQGKDYWFEDGVRQGTMHDPKNVVADGLSRGREIYDSESDGWYWLDSIYNGAKATGKEVWVPYIFQNEDTWSASKTREVASHADPGMQDYVYDCIRGKKGKWIRYDEKGKMLKGWVTISGSLAKLYPQQAGNTYYYDSLTGLMAKGWIQIKGTWYYFNETTGARQ